MLVALMISSAQSHFKSSERILRQMSKVNGQVWMRVTVRIKSGLSYRAFPRLFWEIGKLRELGRIKIVSFERREASRRQIPSQSVNEDVSIKIQHPTSRRWI